MKLKITLHYKMFNATSKMDGQFDAKTAKTAPSSISNIGKN